MPEIYTPTLAEIQNLKRKPGQLKVSGDKVFFSVQGEGQTMGMPAVFLRLHNCNLSCGWCDTRYTWDKTKPEYWQESVDWTIAHAIEQISSYPCTRLVMTGGEPLLQQAGITKLVDAIPKWEIEIETNGTVQPVRNLAERCQFNVSPKLSNSGLAEKRRIKPNVLAAFNKLPKTTFKFVVRDEADLAEIQEIISVCCLDEKKILIMPEGTTTQDIAEHALGVIDQVKERNWRLLPRLHVILWGNRRKV